MVTGERAPADLRELLNAKQAHTIDLDARDSDNRPGRSRAADSRHVACGCGQGRGARARCFSRRGLGTEMVGGVLVFAVAARRGVYAFVALRVACVGVLMVLALRLQFPTVCGWPRSRTIGQSC